MKSPRLGRRGLLLILLVVAHLAAEHLTTRDHLGAAGFAGWLGSGRDTSVPGTKVRR
jgi:hypothetical protein